MIQKMKQWYIHRYHPSREPVREYTAVPTFTLEQVKRSYELGYTDGKRDGLAIARDQAIKSVKDIIWQQNQTKK